MKTVRTGLLSEIIVMSIDTLRASKMRSALTVLGVVIGITSIVGMTSLIRGFDQSLRDLFRQLGPNTLMVQKWGALSFGAGKSFLEVARRPNLTLEDARAIERNCPSVAIVDVWLGATGFNQSRIYFGHEKTKQLGILGATENWSAVSFAKLEYGRLFIPAEVEHRRQVVLLGNTPWKSLFPNVDPIGKTVRIGATPFTVIGVLGPRPSPGGFQTGVDDFAIIPYGTHEKLFGKVLKGSAKITASSFNPAVFRTAMIAVVPREGMRDAAMAEVEALMRIRHNLKLDQPNDFDLATQDAVLGCLGPDQPRDIPWTRRHLVDRADGRRHRGDGDHDDLGDRTDARDRREKGARRPAPRDSLAVPRRGGVPHVSWRSSGNTVRQQHRPCRPRVLRLPCLAALVVVRARDRVLGKRRNLFRLVPGVQGLTAGSD